MDIQPGKYEARIVNYEITQTKQGDPQVQVLFEYHPGGERHEIVWYGNLTHEVGRKIALKALLAMGFNRKNIADLAEGYQSGALDADTPVEIEVERRDKKNGPGTFLAVKWVNRLGGGKFANALPKQEAKAKLASLNLDGELAALRAETGSNVQPIKKAVGQSHDPNFDAESDLPF